MSLPIHPPCLLSVTVSCSFRSLSARLLFVGNVMPGESLHEILIIMINTFLYARLERVRAWTDVVASASRRPSPLKFCIHQLQHHRSRHTLSILFMNVQHITARIVELTTCHPEHPASANNRRAKIARGCCGRGHDICLILFQPSSLQYIFASPRTVLCFRVGDNATDCQKRNHRQRAPNTRPNTPHTVMLGRSQ